MKDRLKKTAFTAKTLHDILQLFQKKYPDGIALCFGLSYNKYLRAYSFLKKSDTICNLAVCGG